ncbi:M56 family metallopeptidase [Pseudoxanthomonas sp. USHLN014]|uniref:M56 family metallopeptidase n=1 Tax=Pseudoxanthomonas sp. USHLN014 TaxID=3081297 RepID=UPI00301DC970
MDAFASELITRLATTSVQTALLVALVWALCRALPRLPASTQCWLWWTVALQAVIGLVAAPLELPWLPTAARASAVLMPATEATAPLVLAPVAPLASAPTLAPLWALPAWQTVLLALWLAGIVVMGLRTALAWRASRALVRASHPCDDAVLSGALRLAAEAHGLRTAPPLRLSRQISSPQLVGVRRPVLLLPTPEAARIGDDDLDMALTHELVHLRRRDLWWGLLPALAQHVAFFHPLVHYAVREYGVAREAAVDAAVIAGNRHCRGDYGRLLVRLGVAPRPGAGLASASPSFLSLKRRLLMLQNTHSFPRIGAALILAGVAVAGVTPLRLVAAAPAPQTPVAEAKPAAAAQPAAAAAPAAPAARAAGMRALLAPPAPPPPPPPAPPADAVPAPPAPPKPPATPFSTRGLFHQSHDASRDAYVLVQGNESTMSGSSEDLRRARALDDGKGVLFVRRAGKSYVIRDAATLSRFKAVYAETSRIGEAQGKLGEQQGALGERQGSIGGRMGEIGSRLGDLAVREAQLSVAGGDSAAARKAIEDAHRATEKARAEMEDPAMQREMAELSRQQEALGQQQAVLGKQQAAASARAQREAELIINQTLQRGLAQPIDG